LGRRGERKKNIFNQACSQPGVNKLGRRGERDKNIFNL
jgi:hypothetical protein